MPKKGKKRLFGELKMTKLRMIKAQNIRKAYGDLQVLKGVDLHIKKGEIVSVIGKSGAGKSTLLHILGTLDRPDSGSLVINDTETRGLKADSLAHFRNKNIGFVFQFHHLLPEFNALENICIPAYIAKAAVKPTEKRAKELLDYLGLGDRMQHKPGQLSGGEQQRVAIARALINSPGVVFADEPTGNLDNSSSQEIHNLLFQLRKDFEQTFVIVTHNNDLAAECDRTLEMSDGILLVGG